MWYNSFLEEGRALIRKPMNFIVLFLMPVLVVIMLSLVLEEEVVSHIPIAIIDGDQTSFSRGLVDAFDQNDTFEVVAYPENVGAIEGMIRDSDIKCGMIIPQNFYEDVAGLNSPTVMMIYDGSNMSVTSTAKAKAVEILMTYKAGAAMSQIGTRLGVSQEQALNMANVVSFETRFLYNPSKSFEDFLAVILMAGYVQAAITLTASVSVDHGIYRRNNKERMGYGLGKVLFYTCAGTLSYLICVSLQVGIFGIPFRGRVGSLVLLAAGLSFAVAAFSVLLSMLFRNRMVALIAGAVVFIPNSSMAGTTWPLSAMPTGYQAFAKYLPFAHFANNLRDIYLKGSRLADFGPSLAYMFVFGGVGLLLIEAVLWLAEKEEEEADDLSEDVQKRIPVNI